jgi:hypothetical protein
MESAKKMENSMLTIEQVTPLEVTPAIAAHSVERPTLTVSPELMEELRTTAQMLASTDATFREALIQNPQATLAALIEMNSGSAYELQKGIEIKVLEQPKDATFIVIPSPDKAEGLNTDIARLSIESATNQELRDMLVTSPAKALGAFMTESGASISPSLNGSDITVHFEEAGELLLVVGQASSSGLSLVADGELLSKGQLDAYMSCCTCECCTARSCCTGDCCTAAGCCTWSSKCNGSSGCR